LIKVVFYDGLINYYTVIYIDLNYFEKKVFATVEM